MRAKTVNESMGKDVPYEKAIELATKAMKKIEGTDKKVMGPSIGEVMTKPGQYYVQTGGVSLYYNDGDLDKLLHAMQVVEDTQENVTWNVFISNDDWSSSRVNFSSDQERKTGEAISKYYRDKPSGGFTGD